MTNGIQTIAKKLWRNGFAELQNRIMIYGEDVGIILKINNFNKSLKMKYIL